MRGRQITRPPPPTPPRLLTQVLCDGDDAKAAMNAHLTMGLDAAWNLGMEPCAWSDLADRTQRKFHSYGSTTTTMYTTTTTILL